MAGVEAPEVAADTPAGDVLEACEALLAQARRMLDHVHEQDWESLLEEVPVYIRQVEWLTRQEADPGMSPRQRQRKARVIEAILGHDAEIRHYLARRRNELARLLRTSRRQRNLSRAYGAPAGATAYPQAAGGRS